MSYRVHRRWSARLPTGLLCALACSCGAPSVASNPHGASGHDALATSPSEQRWPQSCRFEVERPFGPSAAVAGAADHRAAIAAAEAALADARAHAQLVYSADADATAYRAWLDDWIFVEGASVRLASDRVVLAGPLAEWLVDAATAADDRDAAREVLMLAGAPFDLPDALRDCAGTLWEP